MVQLLGVDLTEEQQAILDTCPTPDYRTESGKGQLTRITAAAGTGKTTTLLALALQGARKGHKHITYLTFTKAAAGDGKQRLQRALSHAGLSSNVVVDARTLHSCAHRALVPPVGQHLPDSETQQPILEEKEVKSWIVKESQGRIDEFLQDCFLEIDCRRSDRSKKEEAKERAREQVEFFLFKTLKQFCQQDTSRERFGVRVNNRSRDYYKARLFHEETQLGFEKAIYSRKLSFYANQACRLWDLVVKDNIVSQDFQMKRAQLLGLRIPGTLLLVDESQDMDGCQVSWSAKQQVVLGTHVYVVGDAAQTIYSFRGAKSKSLMALEVDKDCFLTASWRFGEAIARTANCILFSKHKSAQTEVDWNGRVKNWNPYRIKVGIPREDRVTRRCLLPKWRELDQLTLIARGNLTLMFKSLELFGPLADADGGPKTQSPTNVKHDPESNTNVVKHEIRSDVKADDHMRVTGVGDSAALPQEFPKIHINSGSSSGIHTFRKIMSQVEVIYDLYRAGGAGMSLPRQMFPEFKGRKMHWDSFDEECTRREDTNTYLSTYAFVDHYKTRTLQAMESFRTHVIERPFEAAEADIILTTCHAAKGMEWHTVQICEDFIDLNTYKRCNSPPEEELWQFGFKNWGDEVNCLYVACTRAKRQLSIPSSSILRVWENFDSLHQWYLRREVNIAPLSLDDLEFDGAGGVLDEDSASALYRDLVKPLRIEYSLKPHQLLVDTLIDLDGDPGDGESDGDIAMAADTNPNFDVGLVTPHESGIKRESDTDHETSEREPDTEPTNVERESDTDPTNVKRESDTDHENINGESDTNSKKIKREPGT
jgi:superfamily I DNA/RNA helicase